MAKLNAYVHVTDPETNQAVVLQPGDELDEKYADQVGEHCLGEPGEDDGAEPAGPSQRPGDADEAEKRQKRAEASRKARERKADEAEAEARRQADETAAALAAAEAAEKAKGGGS